MKPPFPACFLLGLSVLLAGPRLAAVSAEPTVTLGKVKGRQMGGSVLGLGAADRFDAEWVGCPSVLPDGATYRLWYSAHFDYSPGEPGGGIGLAQSDDGVVWQRAAHGRPVLTPGPRGALDDGQVLAPKVLYDGQLYRMWYTGQPQTRDPVSGFGYYRVFLATSPDGEQWTRANAGRPVIDLGAADAPDSVQAATPAVLREKDGYYAWYAAYASQTNHSICLAYSPDGVRFEKLNHGQPVRGLAPKAYAPIVARYQGQYLMLYMALGKPGEVRSLKAAVSDDRLHWRPLNEGQPVLALGGDDAFDRDLIGHGALLVEAERLRLWYTGYRRETSPRGSMTLRIGLAETP